MSTDKGNAPKGGGGWGEGKRMKQSSNKTRPDHCTMSSVHTWLRDSWGEVNGGAGGIQWAVL